MLFVHGHQFIKHENRYYTSGSLNNKLFERYINIFGAVTVFANQKEVTENDLKHIDDQNKVDNVNLKLMHNKNNIFEIIKNRNKVKEAVAENKYIIIRMPSFYGVLAAMYAQKSNKKYLIELVGCPWDAYWNHSLKGKILAPYSYLKLKRIVKEAPYVIYVTNEFLQKRYPTNGMSTNCSNVALTEFDDKVLKNRLEKIKHIQETHKYIIGTTAAVNVRYKGQQYVIQALGKLKKQGVTNYEYQLVGGGDQRYLKSIAEKYDVVDQIKFLGAMPHNQVFDWLETIDLYVQPSRQEGLPRALIEAMSKAVPSFGARTAGIPELLEGKFIFSNTRKNIDEIIEILKSFDKATMTVQAKRNYEESKKYDKEVIEERRRNFFEDFKKSLAQSKG